MNGEERGSRGATPAPPGWSGGGPLAAVALTPDFSILQRVEWRWPGGGLFPAPGDDAGVAAAPQAAWLLLWDEAWETPGPGTLRALCEGERDVVHAGLKLGMAGLPRLLSFVWPAWMLGKDPNPGIEATSWRLSLRACLIRAELVRQLGGPKPGFESLEAAGLEMGLRYLRAGAIMRYSPQLLPETPPLEPVRLPWKDEVELVLEAAGPKWARWAVLRGWRRGVLPVQVVPRALALISQHARSKGVTVRRTYLRPDPSPARLPAVRVSVLIPTLDRYPYLETLLGQLQRQTVPPHQVIVVDQTPRNRRRHDLPGQFTALPLLWITRDEAGQCSSRNEGLRRVTGEWVLFLDDDVEVPVDFIERHLKTAMRFAADASCGTVYTAGKKPLVELDHFVRISDVFPAGTSLVRRSSLERSGLFDLAYDHGQRADGDLGMRLYLSGALLVLDPGNCILHHHALRGGLRTHGARVVTRATSQRSAWRLHLPSAWDFYLVRQFFGESAARETALIAFASTFFCQGMLGRRILRALVACARAPFTLGALRRAQRSAAAMCLRFPQIPPLENAQSASGHYG